MNPSRAQGINGSGSRTYSPEDIRRVAAVLRPHPQGRTIDQLADATRLPGRTLRAILTERDGIDWLLVGGEHGYCLATIPDDAEVFTRRLSSQAATIFERIDRRRAFAASMERRQLALPLEAA